MTAQTARSTTTRLRMWRGRAASHSLALALTLAISAGSSVAQAAEVGHHSPMAWRASGQNGGVMTMYEGAYRMEMLPLTGKAPTAAELAYASRLAAVAARFGDRYPTTAAARAAGFRTYGVLDVPGQGAHYFDPLASIAADMGGFDANRPPFLVFKGTRLAGIMYFMPVGTSPARLNQLVPRSLAPWHRHVDVCVVGGARTGRVVAAYTPAACAARNGRFYPSTGWMAHVWLGQPVGPGLFTMDQPGTPGGM